MFSVYELGAFALVTLAVLFVIIISISLSEVVKVALYSYARFGIIADGFSPEFIIGAVAPKKTKKK